MDAEKWASQLAGLLLLSCLITQNPASISCYDLRKEVSVLLTDLARPPTHKFIQQAGQHFAALRLVLIIRLNSSAFS